MWTITQSPLGRIAIPSSVPNGFAVFCTTRDFEGRINDAIARQISNAIEEQFGIASSLATCSQVHGATVQRAKSEGTWRECDSCDALWSDDPGVALAIKIADCLPVAMIDASNRVAANVHSGWRGAVQGITAAAVDTVTTSTAFDPASALAYLGPSIRVCCFEVGEEVAERFDARYVDRRHSKPHVDLPAFTRDVLLQRGFAADRIDDSELCTRCDGSVFHSYRREGAGGGRNLQIVTT